MGLIDLDMYKNKSMRDDNCKSSKDETGLKF